MSKKLTIYLDLDEVICKLLDKLCRIYNYKYDKNLKPNDIKTYSLSQYIGEKGIEILKQPGFFGSLEPIEGAIETIKKIVNNGNEVFIISSPMNKYSVFEKYLWVLTHLPFFDVRNLILIGNKGDLLSRLDDENSILFDDCPEYVSKFNGMSVVMDRAYNKELIVGVDCDYRVSGWNEFYEIVKMVKNRSKIL